MLGISPRQSEKCVTLINFRDLYIKMLCKLATQETLEVYQHVVLGSIRKINMRTLVRLEQQRGWVCCTGCPQSLDT